MMPLIYTILTEYGSDTFSYLILCLSIYNLFYSLASGNIMKHRVLFLLHLQCISEITLIYHRVLANNCEALTVTAAVPLVSQILS